MCVEMSISSEFWVCRMATTTVVRAFESVYLQAPRRATQRFASLLGVEAPKLSPFIRAKSPILHRYRLKPLGKAIWFRGSNRPPGFAILSVPASVNPGSGFWLLVLWARGPSFLGLVGDSIPSCTFRWLAVTAEIQYVKSWLQLVNHSSLHGCEWRRGFKLYIQNTNGQGQVEF